MTSHPNRSKRLPKPGSNPLPEEIVAARLKVGLSQAQSAAKIYTSLRTWQGWEQGRRRMPAAAFALFLLRVGLTTLQELDEYDVAWRERRKSHVA